MFNKGRHWAQENWWHYTGVFLKSIHCLTSLIPIPNFQGPPFVYATLEGDESNQVGDSVRQWMDGEMWFRHTCPRSNYIGGDDHDCDENAAAVGIIALFYVSIMYFLCLIFSGTDTAK